MDVKSSNTENIGLFKAILDLANSSSNVAVSSSNILCIGLLTIHYLYSITTIVLLNWIKNIFLENMWKYSNLLTLYWNIKTKVKRCYCISVVRVVTMHQNLYHDNRSLMYHSNCNIAVFKFALPHMVQPV